MKKFITCLTIILIFTASFITGYVRTSYFVYADSEIQWENCDSLEDQASAFKAYCASRNLTIDGSILDAVTKFTTSTYQNLLNEVGLDINALQADIKKTVDSNNGIKFLLTANGATAMNTLFSQFLQDNDLDVGDNVNNKNIYDGKMYTDENGHSSLVWIMPSTSQNDGYNHPIQRGSTYLYDGYDIKNMYDNGITSYSFTFLQSGSTYTITRNLAYAASRDGLTDIYCNGDFIGVSGWGAYLSYGIDNGRAIVGQNIVYFVQGSNVLNFGTYVDLRNNNTGQFYQNERWAKFNGTNDPPANSITNNVTVNITTNNNTINNNTYEDNDTTIINPDGSTNTPSEPLPDPSDDWDIELPDLDINWILTGKENKFPFDIPFNLMFALSLLNAEPEAPHFEGTIDLKVYQWNYSIDLSAYNNVASVMRNLEFLAFLVGLMLMTKKLIWG